MWVQVHRGRKTLPTIIPETGYQQLCHFHLLSRLPSPSVFNWKMIEERIKLEQFSLSGPETGIYHFSHKISCQPHLAEGEVGKCRLAPGPVRRNHLTQFSPHRKYPFLNVWSGNSLHFDSQLILTAETIHSELLRIGFLLLRASGLFCLRASK